MLKINIKRVDWETHRHELLHIRHAVFVDEQGVPVELEHDQYDQSALHLLARSPNETPIATARMLVDGHIGRMAVLPAWRRRGIGSAMLRELIQLARGQGVRELFLNAQCEADPFYQGLGFVTEGEIFRDAGIDHCRMRMHLDTDEG